MSDTPRIIFSHANGFPAGTYHTVFDSLRARGFAVEAIEKFGHDPAYPVTDNWPHLVQQLADFAQAHIDRWGTPAFLTGHSLGGILSLMCAALHPQLARGVVLLDSTVVLGWRANALALAKRTSLTKDVMPHRATRKRRNQWASWQEAFEHFRSRKVFAHWDEQVLRDYIEHGTVASDGSTGARALAFEREIEAKIYDTVPHNLNALLRAHPVQCKVAFIGARKSAELRLAGPDAIRHVSKGRLMMLDGSHLFPMEKPLATAAAMEAALRNLMG
ncbi:MAG: alpha/beta fold hydrolase [Burkholderiaceae bacterium]|jgi:pimeloyl-ACP methyl ester carboxylesterase|nr:alpha/beta fold hydrolase [Burkholderiaceae bacterium]